MMALTLIRPWPWSMLYGPKRIENRKWRPSPSLLRPGERFAIHAGKKFDIEDMHFILRTCGLDTEPAHFRDQGIVGSLRYHGVIDHDVDFDHQHARQLGQSDWFFGPFGWICSEPIILPTPIERPGAMGLWRLDDPLLESSLRGAP